MKDNAPYTILYEDEEIIVVDKKRDVFTVATNDPKTFHHNLFYYLKCYLKKKHEQPYIVHRLDYETSGILIFAKNHDKQVLLRNLFEQRLVRRCYEAVVLEKIPLDFKRKVEMNLQDNHDGKLVKESNEGKEAITYIKANNYIQIGTALQIEIETGRRNQIRLALQSLNLTLIGDKRYAKHQAKRMYLNAYRLSFPKEANLKESDFKMKPLWLIENKEDND